MALLGVTVLLLELYHGREVLALRSEVDALRRDVDGLKHRVLEDDLLEHLKAFEDAVSTCDRQNVCVLRPVEATTVCICLGCC